jgi:hypothetical protein
MSDILATATAIECERVFIVSSEGGPNESISGSLGRGQIGTIMCVPVSKDFEWFWGTISMIDPELLELIKCILMVIVCLPIIFFLFAFASELDEDMDAELSPLDKRREMRSRFVRESSSDEDETSDPVLKMFTKKTNIPTNVTLGPSQKWRYS